MNDLDYIKKHPFAYLKYLPRITGHALVLGGSGGIGSEIGPALVHTVQVRSLSRMVGIKRLQKHCRKNCARQGSHVTSAQSIRLMRRASAHFLTMPSAQSVRRSVLQSIPSAFRRILRLKNRHLKNGGKCST